jgi:hypothetical protein
MIYYRLDINTHKLEKKHLQDFLFQHLHRCGNFWIIEVIVIKQRQKKNYKSPEINS